jgi:hypothetical protein
LDSVPAPINLPERVFEPPWEYPPRKPYLIIDIEAHTGRIIGPASTDWLNKRAASSPTADGASGRNLHAVVDAKARVVLGAPPPPGESTVVVPQHGPLMDRYLDSIDAAIFETPADVGHRHPNDAESRGIAGDATRAHALVGIGESLPWPSPEARPNATNEPVKPPTPRRAVATKPTHRC